MLRSMLVAVMLLAAVASRATEPASGNPAPDAANHAGQGFLWEARRGPDRIYLAGTIHVGNPALAQLDGRLAARLAEVDAIVVEADVRQAKEVAELTQQVALYPAGEPGLDARMPPALRTRIEALLARAAVDPQRAWRMKPWMLANTLAVLESSRLGFSPAYATEVQLFDYAARSAKPVIELEGLRVQLEMLDRAAPDLQLAYLEQTVDQIESGAAAREIGVLVDAWRGRDAAQIERLLVQMHESTSLADRFVVDQVIDARNRTMTATIARLAQSGQLDLVAVGTLHFFGSAGIVSQLRSLGFTVTPVP